LFSLCAAVESGRPLSGVGENSSVAGEQRSRGFLLLVDALGADVAGFAGGDEGIALDETLDDRVLFLVIRVHLRVDHLLAFKSDGTFDQAIVGGFLFELDAFLEFDDSRFESRNRLHLPRVIIRLRHDEIWPELVAHFSQKESDADVAHELVESFLGFQSPSAE